MDSAQTIQQLQEIAGKVFETQEIDLTPDTFFEDINGWSSLTHVMFVDEVEKAFNVQFSFDQMLLFSKIGDLVTAIQEKLK